MAGMKDATMYSTMDGAKKRAKQLKYILERSGLTYSLAKCQSAVARAAGYEDWHDLTRRISQRTNTHLPYDYWGELIRNLPDPCHLPVTSHLRYEFASELSDDASRKCWLRDTLPYLVSLEVVHRTTTQLLRPGSGKDQRIRLNIISGLLLNGEGRRDFAPKLDPESLTVIFDGTPDVILPEQAKHARFGAALNTLSAAGILTVEGRTARIRAPESSELRAEIIRRARSWEAQKEPEIEYVQLRRDVAAAVQR
jgi:hypothetical protein